LYKLAYQVIQKVQWLGSGADVAASVFGGIISYQRQPLEILPLPITWPGLWLVYSGYKTPTAQVLAQVAQRRTHFPTVITQIEDAIGAVSAAALVAIQEQNWLGVGALMNAQQGLMAGLGVSDFILETLIYGLRALPDTLGAKISGSGLGDCVLALGTSRQILLEYPMAYEIKIGHVH
jgi:mevalonate kinase